MVDINFRVKIMIIFCKNNVLYNLYINHVVTMTTVSLIHLICCSFLNILKPPIAQPPVAVVYRTVHNELGVLQNPTGWFVAISFLL